MEFKIPDSKKPNAFSHKNLVYVFPNLLSNASVHCAQASKAEFLIISLGALHHTNNCKEAIKYICKFGETKSYLFLGLYHKYGRKPFLDHFE